MPHHFCVMANRRNSALYVGVTSILARRVYEHRHGLAVGFTKRYGVKRLVYAKPHDRVEDPIHREKNQKHWVRAWTIAPIERDNPDWDDLAYRLNY